MAFKLNKQERENEINNGIHTVFFKILCAFLRNKIALSQEPIDDYQEFYEQHRDNPNIKDYFEGINNIPTYQEYEDKREEELFRRRRPPTEREINLN